jgi:anthranilate synthase component I
MIYDTVVVFDHFRSTTTVVTHIKLPDSTSNDIRSAYEEACTFLRSVLATIHQAETELPPQAPACQDSTSSSENQYSSNVGRSGYEAFITKLKRHISKGDIIQAVPSQRLSRNTTVHPFNIYRTLRSLNPSPYMFYLSCSNFSLVGASPECLMSASTAAGGSDIPRLRIVNHAIAGTIARGKNSVEDDELARLLQNSVKDRAEHVMLVDLARNDVNRVCDPQTVRVDRFMRVDKFSHVQHLTSEVSGILHTEATRWDAFRSIFPAGTVSGGMKSL